MNINILAAISNSSTQTALIQSNSILMLASNETLLVINNAIESNNAATFVVNREFIKSVEHLTFNNDAVFYANKQLEPLKNSDIIESRFMEFEPRSAFYKQCGIIEGSIDLGAMLKHCGKKDVRYYLNGLHFKEGTLIASDGHRLMLIDGVKCSESFTIRREVFKLLNKIKKRGNIQISISECAKYARFCCENVTIYTVSIDTKYPDFSRVLSQSFDDSIDLNVKSIKADLKRDKPLLNKFKGIYFDNGVVNVDAGTIALNADYLNDALIDNIMTLEVATNKGCLLLKAESVTVVIMAMRL